MEPPNRSSTFSTVSEGGLSVRENDLVTQLVKDRYIDLESLKAFLNQKFPGQWKVEVKLNQYTIASPRTITDASSLGASLKQDFGTDFRRRSLRLFPPDLMG